MQFVGLWAQFRIPAHVRAGLEAVHVQDGRQTVPVRNDPQAAVGVQESGADVLVRNGRIDLFPLVILQGPVLGVDDKDAGTARHHEQEASSGPLGHEDQPADELAGLRLPGVLEVEAVEPVVLGVEDRQAGGRAHPFHALVVLAEVMDGVAEEGDVVVLVVPELFEIDAVITQEAAFRAYPQEALPVLADAVDLRVGESQFRSIESRRLREGRLEGGDQQDGQDQALFHFLAHLIQKYKFFLTRKANGSKSTAIVTSHTCKRLQKRYICKKPETNQSINF